MKTKKMVRLSLFLAIGVLLHYLESQIPYSFAVPGVKLGLANISGLLVLYFYNPKEFVFIGFLRVLIVALLYSGFGTAFLLSLSGWGLSTLLVLIMFYSVKPSIYGLSLVSAIFHSLGQILTVMAIYEAIGMINYMPVLLLSSSISGVITARISASVLKRLDKVTI
ncbi:TPA: Gx transporter family protein [bacterium]|jgi:heptaprenyl diphosphate synthase|nr:Gx transporter family protein [bacterium]